MKNVGRNTYENRRRQEQHYTRIEKINQEAEKTIPLKLGLRSRKEVSFFMESLLRKKLQKENKVLRDRYKDELQQIEQKLQTTTNPVELKRLQDSKVQKERSIVATYPVLRRQDYYNKIMLSVRNNFLKERKSLTEKKAKEVKELNKVLGKDPEVKAATKELAKLKEEKVSLQRLAKKPDVTDTIIDSLQKSKEAYTEARNNLKLLKKQKVDTKNVDLLDKEITSLYHGYNKQTNDLNKELEKAFKTDTSQLQIKKSDLTILKQQVKARENLQKTFFDKFRERISTASTGVELDGLVAELRRTRGNDTVADDSKAVALFNALANRREQLLHLPSQQKLTYRTYPSPNESYKTHVERLERGDFSLYEQLKNAGVGKYGTRFNVFRTNNEELAGLVNGSALPQQLKAIKDNKDVITKWEFGLKKAKLQEDMASLAVQQIVSIPFSADENRAKETNNLLQEIKAGRIPNYGLRLTPTKTNPAGIITQLESTTFKFRNIPKEIREMEGITQPEWSRIISEERLSDLRYRRYLGGKGLAEPKFGSSVGGMKKVENLMLEDKRDEDRERFAE